MQIFLKTGFKKKKLIESFKDFRSEAVYIMWRAMGVNHFICTPATNLHPIVTKEPWEETCDELTKNYHPTLLYRAF